MAQKVTIRGGANPLLIDAVDTTRDFISLLFSSDWRSIRSWMIALVDLGGNANWQAIGGTLLTTTAFADVAFGKTFSSFPVTSAFFNDGVYKTNRWYVGPNTIIGQKGGFAVTATDHVRFGNLGQGGISCWALILDLPSAG